MSLKLELNKVPVFQFFDQDDLTNLSPIAKSIVKNKGEAVLLHDEPVPGIYVIVEGECGVYPLGANKPLMIMNAGGAFGEMAFIEKTKASATIRAEAMGTKLAVFFQSDLTKLIEQNSKLGSHLYQGMAFTLSQKLRATNNRVRKELHEGRKHLDEITRAENSPADLKDFGSHTQAQTESFLKDLQACMSLGQDAARHSSDKSLSELNNKLSSLLTRYRSFSLPMAQQISRMVQFVRSMEEFMLWSSHQ